MTHTPQYKLPYGRSTIKFNLPGEMKGTVVLPKSVKPVKDTRVAIDEALKHPIGSPPLIQIAHRGQRVCIVFTDITRSSPDHLLVPALLAELKQCGVREGHITLLCGVGMHRPSNYDEKVTKLGRAIVKRYRVIDNEPENSNELVNLGTTTRGVPVLIHRAAVEADLVITTGIVEPHLYAGYSGGWKTLAIGAAGEATIGHTHGPVFVDHPGTRLGSIEGNPFHEAIEEAARMSGLSFIVNVVLDEQKRILRVAAGDPELAFTELVRFARSVYEVPIDQQYDIVIGGVGYPKDSNLYQASRAPTYLFFVPVPVVRPGGFLIIPARCEEGAGYGVGEQRFLAAMRGAVDIETILRDSRLYGYPPGQQRAFVLAKVLERSQIVIVGSQTPDIVADCKMIPAETMQEALVLAEERIGRSCQVLIVPHAMHTLPVIQNEISS